MVSSAKGGQQLRRVAKDPFAVKRFPKSHPYRVAFTLRARLVDKMSQLLYRRYLLPQRHLDDLPMLPDIDFHDTAVTPVQAQHLLAALASSENQRDTCVVEVGCWAGVTTRLLARNTTRKLYAVDPYLSKGETSPALERFRMRTAGLCGVTHIQKTSGEAALNWEQEPVSMVFIDAVHDYYNVRFDIEAWGRLLLPNGFIAVHDTDQRCFAGARRAVFEASSYYALFAHPDNLTIFRKIQS
jgi:predicted O-methyltransferase YrrM